MVSDDCLIIINGNPYTWKDCLHTEMELQPPSYLAMWSHATSQTGSWLRNLSWSTCSSGAKKTHLYKQSLKLVQFSMPNTCEKGYIYCTPDLWKINNHDYLQPRQSCGLEFKTKLAGRLKFLDFKVNSPPVAWTNTWIPASEIPLQGWF